MGMPQNQQNQENANLAAKIDAIAAKVEKGLLTEARGQELVDRAVQKTLEKIGPKDPEDRFDKKDLEEHVAKLVADFMAKALAGAGGRGLPFPVDEARGRLATALTAEKALIMKTRDPELVEYQRASDQAYLIKTFAKLAKKPEGWGEKTDELEHFRGLHKALYSGGAGAGQEYVPIGFSAQLLERVELATRLWALFPQVKIPMGSDQFTLPLRGTYGTLYLMDEPAADNPTKVTESTPSTGKVTFDPITLGARYLISQNLTEDAMVAMVPLLLGNMERLFARGYEDIALNADDSGSHMDSDVVNAKDHRRGLKGIRKNASVLGGSSFVDLGGAPTEDVLLALKDGIGEWAAFPDRCVWGVSLKVWSKMKRLPSVKTVDKFGANATILTGQLADFDGSAVILSPKMRSDLNAAGVHDGVTTTKSLIALIALDAWATGDKRQLTIEQDKDIEAGQIKIVGSSRIDFRPVHNVAEARPVVVGYNYTN